MGGPGDTGQSPGEVANSGSVTEWKGPTMEETDDLGEKPVRIRPSPMIQTQTSECVRRLFLIVIYD